MTVISAQDLTVRYEQHIALEKVSFEAMHGDFIGIIGPNGGGKTTLVKTILGLLEPSAGHIHIAKDAVIGYVPQVTTFDKNFPISVMDVILTGHLPKGFKLGHRFKGHDEDHAKKVMERLGIIDLANRQIGQLSGGQLQRVLIARALMNHPTILVLDEPTASVDQDTKKRIYEMLRELSKSMTILMITHDTSDMLPYLDHCIYINRTAHIHSANGPEDPMDECPIDWYIEGERIEKAMRAGKAQK